jgi:hypothetical protein
MENQKKPKWEIGITISKGKQSVSLVGTYESDLQTRLQPDEANQHKANVAELEVRQSGQSETLVTQKSKTLGQDEAIDVLHASIINIRNIVKSVNPPGEISKAYGVGEKIIKTVVGVTAAANMVLTAYQANTGWSNNTGIIESDMEEISALKETLGQADDVQETSKFLRKSKTMGKNVLQRAVEDEVTKISALGILEFQKKDPAVATLFAGLIPG